MDRVMQIILLTVSRCGTLEMILSHKSKWQWDTWE